MKMNLVFETPAEMAFIKCFNSDSNKSIVLTGSAGCGKSTILKYCVQNGNRNVVMSAFTGAAARNIDGRTLNSLFQLPIGIITPTTELKCTHSMQECIEKMDCLVIDEIFSCPAYILDAVDRIMRYARKDNRPMGGVRCVLMGDPKQLGPVVNNRDPEECKALADMYGEGMPYVWKSRVWKELNPFNIHLTKIHRQADAEFQQILERASIGRNTEADVARLNQCVRIAFNDKAVTITPFNKAADAINEKEMGKLNTPEFTYEGTTSGDYPFKDADLPAPKQLKLKVGCRVMATRNSAQHGFFNASLGTVTRLTNDEVFVKFDDSSSETNVPRLVWESTENHYNQETKQMETNITGTYTQFPLRIGYAISIHKSQGQTYTAVNIDTTRRFFCDGMGYVALSRCRSLDGITFNHPLNRSYIRQSMEVLQFINDSQLTDDLDAELEAISAIDGAANKGDYDRACREGVRFVRNAIVDGKIHFAAELIRKIYGVMIADELSGAMEGFLDISGNDVDTLLVNAFSAVYSGRYNDAIRYANNILTTATIPEALYIKACAQYLSKAYVAADQTNVELLNGGSYAVIYDSCNDSKALYLASLTNREIGDSCLEFWQRIIKLHPKYHRTYLELRKDMLNAGFSLPQGDEQSPIITKWNDTSLDAEEFKMVLDSLGHDDLMELRKVILKWEENEE